MQDLIVLKKIYNLAPAVAAALILIAASAVSAVSPASVPAAGPAQVAAANVDLALPASRAALADFCARRWGELADDGSYCRFEQVHHVNLTRAGNSLVTTRLAIVPADTLRLEAVALPEAWIGGRAYDASEETFVASIGGYLSFRPLPGHDFLSVQRVTLERCFGSIDGTITPIVCPKRP